MHHAIEQQHEFPDFTIHSVSDSSTPFHVRMANSDLDPHAVARIA